MKSGPCEATGYGPFRIRRMPISVTSFFTEPDDLAAALAHEGSRHLVVTGQGRFRARLTRVSLESLRLLAGDESLARIAFVAVPDHMVLVAVSRGTHPVLTCGGIAMQAGEIMTLGPGTCAHIRTDGPSRWSAILAPVRDLARYGRDFTDNTFALPMCIRRWKPPHTAGRHLRHLHASAIRAIESRQGELIGREAAHGLDQQILEDLIECLSNGAVATKTPFMRRHQDIMARFETLLENESDAPPLLAGIAAALGVSPRVLRCCCQMHLGITPAAYLRLRRTQRTHHTPSARRASRRRCSDTRPRSGKVCVTRKPSPDTPCGADPCQ
jgi:AraC-like DNA-binding protein